MNPQSIATPIHLRNLEKCLDTSSFLDSALNSLNSIVDENGEFDISDINLDDELDPEEKESIKASYFNFSKIDSDSKRRWMKDLLLSESSDESDSTDVITEEDYYYMLKEHEFEKKIQKKYQENPQANNYRYYSTDLFSSHQLYKPPKTEKKFKKFNKKSTKFDAKLENQVLDDFKDFYDDFDFSKRKKTKFEGWKKGMTSPEVMLQRRRKLWISMCKKEMGKTQRAKVNNHKEQIQTCKRTAQLCMKIFRQKAMQSQKNMKETLWRNKRLTREMQAYWKRYERVERDLRRKKEKEAEEQRKIDVELIEAKRQQRKLNFLITQTELYAHFMSKKLGQASPEEQLKILSQLDEQACTYKTGIHDDYDSEVVKAQVKKNVIDAIVTDNERTKQFDKQIVGLKKSLDEQNLSGDISNIEEHPQPSIFRGCLKTYQLKGMNWLANLYDQGISGILADEMGLGKTIQSIAFLCHIAEKYSVWGPFLVISPASTLHNWQQEMERFVPDFRVIPYWGNPNERKILRQFWDTKNLHTKEASFHVVITSYQIIVTDFKYFNRLKWQYMILDEAQAIKSSNSVRWKMLLGFSCRNRLLLSGTPIQNSMAELWALLHFIMPTLFDSHDEFNEWFSKDIESHVENKTGIDEKHLSRLHMILKPFMLRRIKKEVENELSDKIEIMMYCPLTRRQTLLYSALKKKIRLEDLLHYTISGDFQSSDKNWTSNLMNLVMQFRKVCNHPDLFERRDVKIPYLLRFNEMIVPKLIYEHFRYKTFNKKLNIWTNKNVFKSMYYDCNYSTFGFANFVNFSPNDVKEIFDNLGKYLLNNNYEIHLNLIENLVFRLVWLKNIPLNCLFLINCLWNLKNLLNEEQSKELVFTNYSQIESTIYTHTTHKYFWEINEKTLDCMPTNIPKFLFCYLPRIQSNTKRLYCSSMQCVIHEQAFNLKYELKKSNENSKLLEKIQNRLNLLKPLKGWFNISIPDKETLVSDAGKLFVLDNLLTKLKQNGHRVLIYSQMTKMIDLLEEFMWYRKHKYMRLDGSSKISERRDMVADFQARSDIFVFLLSTRAGGLGINLTAADTVIFYDSDWNPTVDQQAMDRAHRLGQTKQVTVYRLICKGTIEERILQRAREKSEIQRMVISGGNFKPDTLKPKEVVSLLLDDEELELKYRQKMEERKNYDESKDKRKKRQNLSNSQNILNDDDNEAKKIKVESDYLDSAISSPLSDDIQESEALEGDSSNEEGIDLESLPSQSLHNQVSPSALGIRQRISRGSRRGRPRGSKNKVTGGLQSNLIYDSFGNITGNSSESVLVIDETSPSSSKTSPNKRRPGRPRLKPVGPANQGNRLLVRPKKTINQSLPVPLSSNVYSLGSPSHSFSSPQKSNLDS